MLRLAWRSSAPAWGGGQQSFKNAFQVFRFPRFQGGGRKYSKTLSRFSRGRSRGCGDTGTRETAMTSEGLSVQRISRPSWAAQMPEIKDVTSAQNPRSPVGPKSMCQTPRRSERPKGLQYPFQEFGGIGKRHGVQTTKSIIASGDRLRLSNRERRSFVSHGALSAQSTPAGLFTPHQDVDHMVLRRPGILYCGADRKF